MQRVDKLRVRTQKFFRYCVNTKILVFLLKFFLNIERLVQEQIVMDCWIFNSSLEKMWQLFPWKLYVLPWDKTNFPAKFVFSVNPIKMKCECNVICIAHCTVSQNHRNNFFCSMTVIFYWNFMSVPRHLSTFKISHKYI